jgi:RNA polymerase sigma-70 factor (ECF subfamily)
MIEDELLKWRFKCGSRDALCRIYEKYEDYLLTVAMALLNDIGVAEDIVHDVFVSFAKSSENFKLRGSLRSYLATCVSNRARDQIRRDQRQLASLDDTGSLSSEAERPDLRVSQTEELQQLNDAITQLPYEQREVIVLHLKAGMKFREIAKLHRVSINTVQGRYRYGLSKLRSILDGEVRK